MVTASHNPKRDNGFKVYWGNGAQIIPPHDSNISHHIQENMKPWQAFDLNGVPSHPLAKDVTDEVTDAYFTAIRSLSTRHDLNASSTVKTAYTGTYLTQIPPLFIFTSLLTSNSYAWCWSEMDSSFF